MLSTKPNRCKHCRERMPEDKARHVLHDACIAPFLSKLADKKEAARKKKERAEDRVKRAKLKSLRDLLADAQVPFNAYIRLRDAYLPCVSCGVVNPEMTTGGQWDAGHFLSRGAHPELRFNEDNCHKQCKSCNAGSGKFAHKERTVTQKFEEELRRRIGSERVDFLKGPQPAKKWQRDELIAIKAEYVKRLRELKRGAV